MEDNMDCKKIISKYGTVPVTVPFKQMSISYTLTPKNIMTFTNGLHDLQENLIESMVRYKEEQGYPEANLIINHIRGLK